MYIHDTGPLEKNTGPRIESDIILATFIFPAIQVFIPHLPGEGC
jgi:hypothetical protein